MSALNPFKYFYSTYNLSYSICLNVPSRMSESIGPNIFFFHKKLVDILKECKKHCYYNALNLPVVFAVGCWKLQKRKRKKKIKFTTSLRM